MRNLLTTLRVSFLLMLSLPALKVSAQTNYGTLTNASLSSRVFSNLELFFDSQSQHGFFESPAGSGKSAIFASSFWLGGLDNSNVLHVSQQTYAQAGDQNFYPGPLDTLNATAAVPALWDHVWCLTKAQVLYHIANWNQPWYVMPTDIETWPGNAPVGSSYNQVLAPFYDSNMNSIYEPALGEYPVFPGDVAAYFIANDNYAAPQNGTPSMKTEYHVLAYMYNSADVAVSNTVFVKLQMKNFSGQDYHDVYFSNWTDFDLGNAADDHVGTDVGQSMVYVVNGDPNDEGSNCYGYNAPACGLKFLNTSISHSMYYYNINNDTLKGNPVLGEDFYHLLKSEWMNGQHMTYGNAGFDLVGTNCNYAFPGLTDPAFPGNDWTMASAGVVPDDWRILGTVGPFDLLAGGVKTFEMAYVVSYGSNGTLSSLGQLLTDAQHIQDLYNGSALTINDIEHHNLMVKSSLTGSTVEIVCPDDMKGKKIALKIFDLTGQEVLVSNYSSVDLLSVDVSNLSAGMYIVSLSDGNKNYTSKIICQ